MEVGLHRNVLLKKITAWQVYKERENKWNTEGEGVRRAKPVVGRCKRLHSEMKKVTRWHLKKKKPARRQNKKVQEMRNKSGWGQCLKRTLVCAAKEHGAIAVSHVLSGYAQLFSPHRV